MIEILNGNRPGVEPDSGETILYISQTTGLVTGIGGAPVSATVTQAASSIDHDNTIDGKSSLSLPTAAGYKLWTLASPINLEEGLNKNFTIEGSIRQIAVPPNGAYRTILKMFNSSTVQGYGIFWGDNGYNNNLYQWQDDLVQNGRPKNRWALDIAKADYGYDVMHYAAVLDRGKIYFYLNGILQSTRNINGSPSGGVRVNGFDIVTHMNSLSSIRLGWISTSSPNTPSFHGDLRISNFARYRENYVPEPFDH